MNRNILETNVYYYTNVIDNPYDFLDIVESTEFQDCENYISRWEEWNSCSGQEYNYGIKKTVYKKENMDNNVSEYIFNTINDAFYKVCKDYAEQHNDLEEPKLYPGFNIQKYKTGASMGAHFDQQEGDTRLKYSLVMYLNDDYEGGEISFTIQSPDAPIIKNQPNIDYDVAIVDQKDLITFGIKPEAGSVIIFPSSPPYHHTAHLVKSGYKYIIPMHWMYEL